MLYWIVDQKWSRFKWQDGILAVGLALLTVGVGYGLKTKLEKSKVELVKAKVLPTVTVVLPATITIDVEGEVIHPGVYRLLKGNRVEEALIAAGGLAANADREWIGKNLNRAEMLSDGMKIFIPGQQSSQTGLSGGQATSIVMQAGGVLGSQTKIVNINSATVVELDILPGIGPALAGRIIDYRNQNGGFKDINELKLVSGIGDKLYEKLKDLIEI